MNEQEPSQHCRQMLGVFSEYIDGELQAEVCAELERHMKECDNCRVVVNTMKKTIEVYQHATESVELPGTVRERLFFKLLLQDYLNKD